MGIPTLITDLSTTAASCSPASGDAVFPDIDNYIRALSAFIASIAANSGNGWTSPYLALAGGTLTGNLAIGNGTTSLTGTVNGPASGTAGGGALVVQNASSTKIGIGNYSNLLGGTYDATPTIYTSGGLKITDGATLRMSVAASGNVGIGADPDAGVKLDVHATAASSGSINLRLIDDATARNVQLLQLGATYSYAGATGPAAWVYCSGSQDMILGPDSANAVRVVTGGGERMRVDGSGHVTIWAGNLSVGSGNDSVTKAKIMASSLVEDGSPLIATINQNTSPDTLQGYIANSSSHVVLGNWRSGDLVFAPAQVERFRMKAGGSVRFIPCSTPGAPEEGEVYFDSTSKKLRCYNGSTWNDLW